MSCIRDFVSAHTLRVEFGLANEMDQLDRNYKVRPSACVHIYISVCVCLCVSGRGSIILLGLTWADEFLCVVVIDRCDN